MDMKVEPFRPIAGDAVAGPDRARNEAAAADPAAARPDALRLSGDLDLANRAVRAATEGDDPSSVVAEVRGRYERGELAVDVDRLADSMIDALLHSNDDQA
jgi:anti-sigma28 factor (negative regulator of flagellin synthesis)